MGVFAAITLNLKGAPSFRPLLAKEWAEVFPRHPERGCPIQASAASLSGRFATITLNLKGAPSFRPLLTKEWAEVFPRHPERGRVERHASESKDLLFGWKHHALAW